MNRLSFSRFGLVSALVGLLTSVSILCAADAPADSRFEGPLGLQLYSLRAQFAKDVPGTLDMVKKLGIQNVELAGTYGKTPEEFKSMLDARGLKAIGGHFGFEDFRTNLDSLVQQAKALGLSYVGCAWIPHNGPFTEAQCRDAVKVFNYAGDVLSKHGLKFYYHVHGYEFQPFRDGTLLDMMMKGTNPETVSFEMDVFWIVFPNQDPVKLLEKFGSRWELMHLKGMKESTKTGELTGGTDVNNDVAVGQGKIDFPPILRAAKKAGVKWYFIEDESKSSVEQIPQSIDYLKTVKL
ncbi:MAG: sugar phosphate isomerase/epimerase [Verrucomicrobiota bacterium]